jgi:hypothetical protein
MGRSIKRPWMLGMEYNVNRVVAPETAVPYPLCLVEPVPKSTNEFLPRRIRLIRGRANVLPFSSITHTSYCWPPHQHYNCTYGNLVRQA